MVSRSHAAGNWRSDGLVAALGEDAFATRGLQRLDLTGNVLVGGAYPYLPELGHGVIHLCTSTLYK
jgi:hypothetical protein